MGCIAERVLRIENNTKKGLLGPTNSGKVTRAASMNIAAMKPAAAINRNSWHPVSCPMVADRLFSNFQTFVPSVFTPKSPQNLLTLTGKCDHMMMSFAAFNAVAGEDGNVDKLVTRMHFS